MGYTISDLNFSLVLILKRKAPKSLPDTEVLLAEMSYELIPAVDHAEKLIRDAKDQPILNAAIVSDVDIILTGDKDFLSLDIEHPNCMTVAQFLENEGVEESPLSRLRLKILFLSAFSCRMNDPKSTMQKRQCSMRWTHTVLSSFYDIDQPRQISIYEAVCCTALPSSSTAVCAAILPAVE